MEKEKVSEQFKDQFSKAFRSMWMDLLCHTTRDMIANCANCFNKEPQSEHVTFKKKVAVAIGDEMTSAYAVASAIKHHGAPKSLIFITQEGVAIDLLKIENLNEEAVFDQIIDNFKK